MDNMAKGFDEILYTKVGLCIASQVSEPTDSIYNLLKVPLTQCP